MDNYTGRTWTLATIPFAEADSLPLIPTFIPESNVVGITSQAAEDLERRGVTNVFYYDLEQETAGLDKVYGLMSLSQAAEVFTLSDGTSVRAEALVAAVTLIDLDAGTLTLMVEV